MSFSDLDCATEMIIFESILTTFTSRFIFLRLLGQYKKLALFQGFSKAKSANGGLILSSSQFLILPKLPQKMKLALKVVKVDSKIIISLPKI